MKSRRFMGTPLGPGPHLTTSLHEPLCCASQRKQEAHARDGPIAAANSFERGGGTCLNTGRPDRRTASLLWAISGHHCNKTIRRDVIFAARNAFASSAQTCMPLAPPKQ
jgi:hypothetical protein